MFAEPVLEPTVLGGFDSASVTLADMMDDSAPLSESTLCWGGGGGGGLTIDYVFLLIHLVILFHQITKIKIKHLNKQQK